VLAGAATLMMITVVSDSIGASGSCCWRAAFDFPREANFSLC